MKIRWPARRARTTDSHPDPEFGWHHNLAGEFDPNPDTAVWSEAGSAAGYADGYGAEWKGDPGLDPGLEAALDPGLDGELAALVAGEHTSTERDWLPEFVHVTPRHVAVGAELAAPLVIIGYPREVSGGWLEPLTSYPGRLDVSLHIEPIPPQLASVRLRRQLARMESSRHGDAEHGRLADPYLDAATADAYELAGRVARSETRLFRVALSLLVRASSPEELAEHVAAVGSLAASMLLDARPATYRALRGWTNALPVGIDALAQRRTMDTDALAASFPFASTDLPAGDPVRVTAPRGVLYGRNLSGPGLVFWDRWSQENYNSVTLARSGAGKSYLTKLELLRGLYHGVQGLGIDPENEYERLTHAVGGTYIRMGEPGVRINPLDLPHPHHTARRSRAGVGSDALTRRQLYTHTVLAVLLGEALSPAQRAVADRGIHACYARAGITHDPSTWTRPAPLLADLAAALAELADTDGLGAQLAARLQPFTTGSFAGLFNGPTTHHTQPDTQPGGGPGGGGVHLVMFSLAALPEELRAIGTLLALDAIWRTLTDPPPNPAPPPGAPFDTTLDTGVGVPPRRLVVVDEAWSLLQHPTGAQFLYRLGKSARKKRAALALCTQDAGDVLGSDLGRAVVANAATHLLLRTAPHAADQITEAFGLSQGERAFITSADTGNALLIGGHRHRVALRAEASDQEHFLITTNPEELAAHHSPHVNPHDSSDQGHHPSAHPGAHPRVQPAHDGPITEPIARPLAHGPSPYTSPAAFEEDDPL